MFRFVKPVCLVLMTQLIIDFLSCVSRLVVFERKNERERVGERVGGREREREREREGEKGRYPSSFIELYMYVKNNLLSSKYLCLSVQRTYLLISLKVLVLFDS